jgi:hypothetical protein
MTNSVNDKNGAASGGIKLSILCALLLTLFALDNILLLQFLGMPTALTLLLIITLCSAVAKLAAKTILNDVIVPWRAIIIAGIIALLLFMLGGQGRFFYANADWQVRDSILADMAKYPWPFAYLVEGEAAILRAPISLYLLPSLAGGGWHELAMLAANTLRLTLMISICWPLFTTNRHRWFGLMVFLLFSGLDIIGTALFSQLGVELSWDHLERWNFNNQYSAHVTQAFWVPQHAMAGWICAFTFLLWQRGIAKIGLFAATVPLVALWSPLAIMGAVPFALFAGLQVLRNGQWNKTDVATTLLGIIIAIPSLLYLQADSAKLGSGLRDITLGSYAFLILFEILPFIFPLLRSRFADAHNKMILGIVIACLLLMPLYQIGASSDFQMRASIMPLAILAIFFAQWLARLADNLPEARAAFSYAAIVIGIGAFTPIFETGRAVTLGPSPKPLCSLIGVWHKQQGLLVAPYATYFASPKLLETYIGPVAILAGKNDPEQCWAGEWAPIR